MGLNVSTANTDVKTVNVPNKGALRCRSFKSDITGLPTVDRFCHVPYAVQINGQTRFTLPQALPEDFDYSGDYTDLALKCPQPSVPNPAFNYVKSPSDENIQYLNIWVPTSDKYKPQHGWPVLFYIHGGWLQYNSPNGDQFNIIEQFDDEEFQQKYILVSPGYRLNMFGFLSAKELLEENPKNSNFGFWDQRLALEWTYKNIADFGGNPEKITAAGLSAGSYSLFFQLAYELYHQEEFQIIKQCVFFSNMVYVQPKTVEECQEQFDEIIEKLGVSKDASGAEKLDALRKLETDFIEEFIPTLSLHTFRAVTDGDFVNPNLIKDLNSGKLAEMIKAKGIRIMNGEVDNEAVKYSLLNTPLTMDELPLQVENYYPRELVPTLLELYESNKIDISLPEDDFKEELRKNYGAIIGDGQVYASGRGFIHKLVTNGFPAEDLFRYRISFRANWLNEHVEPEVNVPHAADISVWFFNMRKGYTEAERKATNTWLKPYLSFLNFDEQIKGWPSHDPKKMRVFKRDGSESYEEDPDWDWGIKVSEAVYSAQT